MERILPRNGPEVAFATRPVSTYLSNGCVESERKEHIQNGIRQMLRLWSLQQDHRAATFSPNIAKNIAFNCFERCPIGGWLICACGSNETSIISFAQFNRIRSVVLSIL